MAANDHRDRVVDEVTDKVVHKPGTDADEATVRAAAEDAVDDLIDAPVQTFTPLLAENAVVSEMHETAHREGEGETDRDAD